MRETRSYGSVRGVPGDWHPYRDSEIFEIRPAPGLLTVPPRFCPACRLKILMSGMSVIRVRPARFPSTLKRFNRTFVDPSVRIPLQSSLVR